MEKKFQRKILFKILAYERINERKKKSEMK